MATPATLPAAAPPPAISSKRSREADARGSSHTHALEYSPMYTMPATCIPTPRHFASHPLRPFSTCALPWKEVAHPTEVVRAAKTTQYIVFIETPF
jgi:hypothetical protein